MGKSFSIMQVFITSTNIIETVKQLDPKRFNKQIIETRQILKALRGESKAWKNHPCVLQYSNHITWLELYLRCFEEYKIGNFGLALSCSILATEHTPLFHTPEYLTQMKRRLYTKDQEYYKLWSEFGTSDINWYWVEGEWRYYVAGKRVVI